MRNITILFLLAFSIAACTQRESEADQKKGAYKIGSTGPGGGVIFYVKGNTYMEISPNLGDYKWSDAIKAAKDYRGGGYTNWYLPSKDELNLAYINWFKSIHDTGDDDLNFMFSMTVSDVCWSSSEYNSDSAWYQDFIGGDQDKIPKIFRYGVRAVRTFNP